MKLVESIDSEPNHSMSLHRTNVVTNKDVNSFYHFHVSSTKSVPSPALRRGQVYCVWSFTERAQQWYVEELCKQLRHHIRHSERGGLRRQPSRSAKDKSPENDYTLKEEGVEPIFLPAKEVESRDSWTKVQRGEVWRLEGLLKIFRIQLNEAISLKNAYMHAHIYQHGTQSLCTVASRPWSCVDEKYCGHGVVDRCVQWGENYRELLRREMDDFFASQAGNEYFAHLPSQKRTRVTRLREETLARLYRLKANRARKAMPEATMLESPMLGKWPEKMDFPREDVTVQMVEISGLAFALDICSGVLRILML